MPVFSALVALLLRACGPTAIGWLVGTVVVNAVKRVVLRRPTAHVGKEECVYAPAVTHANAAAAIIHIRLVLLVYTSLNHVGPSRKFRSPSGAFRVSVHRQGETYAFHSEASTARSVAGAEASAGNYPSVSTVAATDPVGTGEVSNRSSENFISTKTLAWFVEDACWHSFILHRRVCVS